MFINFFSFFHNFVSRKKGDKVLTEIFLLENVEECLCLFILHVELVGQGLDR